VDSAAAWHADGDGSRVGIKLAVADGGVHQDDVLGVDEPGSAGAGYHVAGQAGELTVRVGGPAVMTPRMPPGRSTRWQAAYSSPGSGQLSPPGCAA
jgi:hypothetical protein